MYINTGTHAPDRSKDALVSEDYITEATPSTSTHSDNMGNYLCTNDNIY